MFLLNFTLISGISFSSLPPGPPPTADEVRKALASGVTHLERAGVNWLDKNKCIACHHGQWMLWGMNEARRAGVAVDTTRLDELTSRVATMYLAERAKYEKDKQGYVEGTYLLLSHYDTGQPADAKVAEARELAATLIAGAQQTNSSWKYAGQGLAWSAAQADEATTMWAAIALDATKADEKATASRDRALAWLQKAQPGTTNSSLALRLAIELRFGDPGRAKVLTKQLIDRQNLDGGWSWTKHRPSDAFATGESLYVLGLAGVKDDDAAIGAARRFLLSTQQPDGSWESPTRKAKGGSAISSYWGSAWAVIGLSRTLNEQGK